MSLSDFLEPDKKWMQLALREAEAAWDEDEVPVGAVVVHAGEIVGRGRNMVERLQDPTAHAEMIALTAACETLGAKMLRGCTLYVTLEPCPMCAGAIVWANIRRVVFGMGMDAIYRLFDAEPDAPALPMHAAGVFSKAPWPMEVIGPLLKSEAEAVFHEDVLSYRKNSTTKEI